MIRKIQKMIQAGLHIGHLKQQRNPRMIPYIYKEKNNLHIINLIKTYSHLQDVLNVLFKLTSQGKTILFVGTKSQASPLVKEIATECNSFYVTERWVGGLLTNWSTLKNSIFRLNSLNNRKKNNISLQLSKKENAKLKKKKDRLEKYFGGLRKMVSLPDIVIIIDQQHELNAVRECQKCQKQNIRNITIVDTNGDPTLADLFIPANAGSYNSLKFILEEFLRYILYGQKLFKKKTLKKPFKKKIPKKLFKRKISKKLFKDKILTKGLKFN